MAVKAHFRHVYTEYNSLLAAGCDSEMAREQVRGEVERIHMECMKGQEPEKED